MIQAGTNPDEEADPQWLTEESEPLPSKNHPDSSYHAAQVDLGRVLFCLLRR